LSLDGDIFLEKFSGTQTGNDDDTIAFTRNEMGNIINDFVRLSVGDDRIKYNKTQTKSKSGWSFEKAKLDVINTGADDKNIVEVAYRPFDNRYTYFTGNSSGFHRRPNGMMRNLANKDNLAIISVRQVAEGKFSHAFITKSIADLRIMTSNKGTAFAFPLYIYEENSDVPNPDSNFNPAFIQKIESTLNLKLGIDFDYEALIHYIYAILNSPVYRSRYAEFLQYDYPKIPIINDVEKFKTLCGLGKSLKEAHLLENVPTVLSISYPITGNDIISKVIYKDNKLFINNTQYFEGVSSIVYDAIFGGHQVVKKWLVARNNYKLEYTDIVYLKRC
jgi:predicted helicase